MASDYFESTLWSRIGDVQKGEPSAVWTFVDRYRPPLVKYVSRKGFSPEDAEDLAQEVMIRLFTKDALARADRERGRFRSFLIGICKNVMREERSRRGAKKRGGGDKPIPLSDVPEIATHASDEEFDRLWAEQLLARAFDALRTENPRQHRVLLIRFQEDISAAELAERLNRSVQHVRNDLHRSRKRLARFVRAEIARYCSSKEEFDDELALFVSLAGLGGEALADEEPVEPT